MSIIRCFTDGAAKNNNKNASAGWAFYIPKYNIRQSGNIKGTNNQAELTAIKKLLTFIDRENKQFEEYTQILLFTDSKYCINVLTGGKYLKNIELINSIFEIQKKINKQIKFKHVDAHTGNNDWVSKCNEIVDTLASTAAKNNKKNQQ